MVTNLSAEGMTTPGGRAGVCSTEKSNPNNNRDNYCSNRLAIIQLNVLLSRLLSFSWRHWQRSSDLVVIT